MNQESTSPSASSAPAWTRTLLVCACLSAERLRLLHAPHGRHIRDAVEEDLPYKPRHDPCFVRKRS